MAEGPLERIQSVAANTTANIPVALKEATSYDTAVAQAEVTVTAPVGTPENPSDRIFTLANFITFCRFLLTIAFLVLFIRRRHRTLALIFYSVAAITDFLDGFVARRTQTVSWLGKVMDPIMDRVLLVTGVIGLLATGELPIWVAVYVIGRDAGLAFGTYRLRRYSKRPVDVLFIGKLATACLMFGFADLLVGWFVVPGLGITTISWLPGFTSQALPIGIFFVYFGIICSAIAAIIYVRNGFKTKHAYLASLAAQEEEAR